MCRGIMDCREPGSSRGGGGGPPTVATMDDLRMIELEEQ